MFGTIRRHQKWLWIAVSTVTIISFVAFFSPQQRRQGGWTGPNYAVAYAIGDTPLGPFERVATILQQDPAVATGAGHHSVLQAPRSGRWYIVYHRRPLGRRDRNDRVVCIDELRFDEHGAILPVVITAEGVARDPVR